MRAEESFLLVETLGHVVLVFFFLVLGPLPVEDLADVLLDFGEVFVVGGGCFGSGPVVGRVAAVGVEHLYNNNETTADHDEAAAVGILERAEPLEHAPAADHPAAEREQPAEVPVGQEQPRGKYGWRVA